MGESDSSPLNPTYLVCGLCVRSNRFIPDLIPSESSSTDVEVSFQEQPQSLRFARETLRYSSNESTLSGEPAVRLWETASSPSLYELFYADGTRFVIDRAGSKVWANWASGSTFEDTLTYLLGPVLGFVLRLRGTTCLHASAIAIDGVAIALAGPGGVGKSTAAAQFASRGYPILSDDIVTLQEAGMLFLVQPSPARLRLWPSSVEHLYGHPDALPRLTPSWEKRYLDLRTGGLHFQSTAQPLAAIYVLGNNEDSAAEIDDLHGSAGMLQLLANVYVNYLLDDSFRESDFLRIAKVVNTIPVRKVNLRHNFGALDQTCRSIATDFYQARNSAHRIQDRGPYPSACVSCLD